MPFSFLLLYAETLHQNTHFPPANMSVYRDETSLPVYKSPQFANMGLFPS